MPGGGRRDAVARRAGLRPTTEPLSGFRENTFAAHGHRRGDQHRSACRLAGGAATGQDADLALCGTGACARPVLGEPLRLNRAHTPLPNFFAQCRQYISILYYVNNLCSIKSKGARLGGALVSYEGLTNSIRAVFMHLRKAQRITSCAWIRSIGGNMIPRAWAVLRLRTSSKCI